MNSRPCGVECIGRHRHWVVVVVVALGLCGACATLDRPALDLPSFDTVVKALRRPLPGPFVALYRLRVPSTGGLRLSVIAESDRGRMTVSENLGGALVVAGWDNRGSEVFDLRKGCRLEGESALGALGIGSLPLDRVILLLGGRAPAIEGDRVRSWTMDGWMEINGEEWRAVAQFKADPVRIVSLRGEDWAVELGDHTSSVPGTLRVESGSGDWAELELIRLQWEYSGDLPPLPDLPVCGHD